MFSKLLKIAKTLTLWIIVASAANAQSALQNLDGHWYSAEWKYGYVLRNGIGTATSTNSPNFQVGQNIIQLTSTSAGTFSGQQVYTDGRFYNVNARLLSDGRLYFEGEKNVQWTMQRVGSTPQASAKGATPAASSSQCFGSFDEWLKSQGGREVAALSQPMREKLPAAQANPYAMDLAFWRNSCDLTNNLLAKISNTRFCNSSAQREFDDVRNSFVGMRDHSCKVVTLWKNVETSYEKSIQGLNCPAYKEAQYKCATAGNPSHCIKVLFPAVNEMYANCR
jgi:hypothetical protein